MYTDQGFIDLVPGAIGTIYYKKNMLVNLSDKAKQEYISKASNQKMRAWMNNATSDSNPQEAFIKSRQDAWKELEDGENNIGVEINNIQIQINQKESYELILNIESNNYFSGWLNPYFINMIKEQFKKLKEQNG